MSELTRIRIDFFLIVACGIGIGLIIGWNLWGAP